MSLIFCCNNEINGFYIFGGLKVVLYQPRMYLKIRPIVPNLKVPS